MGHKVHPKAYRIREITDWDSRGYYKNPAQCLEEDFRIREFLRKKLNRVGVEKIEIERFPEKINIIISSARPGLIIGRGGEGIEQLRRELDQKVLKKTLIKTMEEEEKKTAKEKALPSAKAGKGRLIGKGREVRIEIREIRDPWASANLSAQWVAQQIEKRVPYRRVLKQGISKIAERKGIQGAKIEIAGRLNGAEIARREWLKTGRLPLQTIRADIDYARVRAYCTYGVIGIKVWIYKGEKFKK